MSNPGVNEVDSKLIDAKVREIAESVAAVVCETLAVAPPSAIKWYASDQDHKLTLGRTVRESRAIWLYGHQIDPTKLVGTVAHECVHLALYDALKSGSEFERITERLARLFGDFVSGGTIEDAD